MSKLNELSCGPEPGDSDTDSIAEGSEEQEEAYPPSDGDDDEGDDEARGAFDHF